MKNIFIIFSILLLNIFQACASQELIQSYGENNKFGLIKNDQKITPAIYKKLIRLGDNSWLFLKNTKYGIISNEGEILIEAKYTNAYRFSGGKFARLGSKGKYALFNEFGQAITTQEYQSIEILYGKMFLVEKDYKFGLINYDGDIILAPIADDIYMPKPNVLKIQYENVWYEIEQKNKESIELPSDLADIDENNENFKITQLAQKPIASTGYGIISASDYCIKLFSSISPSYEQTIDELIFNNGADSLSALVKFSWLFKFPYVYTKNYINNIKTPNNGPLSDVKNNLKNKIKN
ncbi:MAG: WG repeat-containing protein [Candidatus Gastranaerophilales bacterium]|nr:WG repeat-containing protein [Candidatus Gastranaerophilales bacterium]